MHIILLILGVLGGAAFWWWRIKQVGQAANEVHDMAGRMWGKYKRKKFLNKVNDSPLEVIDDPATAAVILFHVIQVEDGISGPEADAALRREVVETIGITDPGEIITFGKWTANHASDANTVILRYGKLWSDNLTVREREGLVDMATRICHGPQVATLTSIQTARLARLRQRLGLAVA
jgi:hypothetical protein